MIVPVLRHLSLWPKMDVLRFAYHIQTALNFFSYHNDSNGYRQISESSEKDDKTST